MNRYLSHAAYGHMEFVHSFVTGILPGRRTFPFHAGYDAFKDEAGMTTTDVAAKPTGSPEGRSEAGPWLRNLRLASRLAQLANTRN